MTLPSFPLPGETMKAGRELDALIAEKVFGKRTRKVRYVEGYTYEKGHLLDSEHQTVIFGEALAEEMDDGEVLYGAYGCDGAFIKAKLVPHYSTDISDAWKVVEAVQKAHPGWRFSLLGGDESWGYTRARNAKGSADIHLVDKSVRHAFGWHARFFGEEDPTINYGETHGESRHESTPALAICLAALVASRVPENKEGK